MLGLAQHHLSLLVAVGIMLFLTVVIYLKVREIESRD